jgi:CPA2 family monovalent cation:H+ antiporter-2
MVVKRVEKVRGEGFILFALSVVFLSSALAELFGIAAMVGAFLIGMGFSETKLSEPMKKELSSFKSAFVAVFFISFGMMIDWRVFSQVGHIIIIAVPITIINELLLLAIVAFIIGLSAEAAVSVGAGALGRSEEAIIFANLGTNLKTSGGQPILASGGTTLAPFAGGFCLIMSAVTPFFMKSSYQIAGFFRAKLPAYIKFGGSLISRMLRGIVMNVKMVKTGREGLLTTSLTAYFIFMIFLIGCGGISQKSLFLGFPLVLIMSIILIALTAASICMVGYLLSHRFYATVRTMEIPNLPLNREGRREAVRYVSGFVAGSFSVFLIMAVAWQFDWRYTLLVLVAYVLIVMLASYRIYHRLVGEIQWRAREEIRVSRTRRPVVLPHRPPTFTYRGSSWGHRNPKLGKGK